MNLGVIETTLVDRLRRALGSEIEWIRGPAARGPATGLRPEVFVHAARFDDLDGRGRDGARAGRWRASQGKSSGWREDRPAQIEVDLGCVCGLHAQAQELAGHVVPLALEQLGRLRALRLSDVLDRERVLCFADHDAVITRQLCTALGDAAQVLTTLRLTGVLQVKIVAADGLAPIDPYAQPLVLRIEADPAGVDLAAERVCLSVEGADVVDLSGWQIADAAGHVYRFGAGTRLAPEQGLSLWSGRGKADGQNLYWGRRKAVWNNTGDVALLIDPEGRERVRAAWQPPQPPVRRRRTPRT